MRSAFCLLAFVSILIGGCGASVGQSTGKVTLKGQPIAGAEVKFISAADAKQEFFGRSDATGAYAMSYRESTGMPVGSYTITIRYSLLRSGKSLPEGEAGQQLRDDPNKVKTFAKQFTKPIESGANTLDFELDQGQSVAVPD